MLKRFLSLIAVLLCFCLVFVCACGGSESQGGDEPSYDKTEEDDGVLRDLYLSVGDTYDFAAMGMKVVEKKSGASVTVKDSKIKAFAKVVSKIEV